VAAGGRGDHAGGRRTAGEHLASVQGHPFPPSVGWLTGVRLA